MRLIIKPDYAAVSAWAANYVAGRINDHARGGEARPFVLGLPTGSSPVGTYGALAALNRAGKVSFKNVVTFNMDEYVGLGEEHPQSYHRFMEENLFSKIDIPSGNANLLDGDAADLEAECRRYEERIARCGGIDLFVGGIGEDGHIAFNEPGSSLASRTRAMTLAEDTRKVNARFFGGEPGKVPAMALTVGVGTIMDAREILLVVSGTNKARALRHAVEEGVSQLWTASCVQLHPKAILVCDEDSIAELKVGTARYFTGIEKKEFDYPA